MSSACSIFALPPSELFGRAVAADLGHELASYELRRFDDGELELRPLAPVRGHDLYVIGSLYGDADESVHDRLCRMLFFVGALRDSGAARITVVAPYLCYARKDRRTRPGDPVSTRYVALLLEAAGADRVLTLDVHNLAAYENAFRIGTEHLEARPLFVAASHELARPLAVVSPDPGDLHRAEGLRDALARDGGQPVELAMLGEHREGGSVRAEALVGHVEGRTAVIVDDMIVTGTTLIRAAEACLQRGALSVHAMVTHGMFVPSAVRTLAASPLERILITDTIAPERIDLAPLHPKLAVTSVAPLVARTILALRDDTSLTEISER